MNHLINAKLELEPRTVSHQGILSTKYGATITIETEDHEFMNSLVAALQSVEDTRAFKNTEIGEMLEAGKSWIDSFTHKQGYEVFTAWGMEDWQVVLRRVNSKVILTESLINRFRIEFPPA